MVLLAMGFLGPERSIIEQLQLDQDPRSNIATPKDQYSTSVDRVFAAGGNFFIIWIQEYLVILSFIFALTFRLSSRAVTCCLGYR